MRHLVHGGMTTSPALPGDFYSVFSLDRKLVVDKWALQRKFYELSRQYHPDRFANRRASEQMYALDFAAMLNDAFRVLKTGSTGRVSAQAGRLRYRGAAFEGRYEPELLEEVFELNMILESAPDRPEIEEAEAKFLGMQSETDKELGNLPAKYDETGDSAVLTHIRAVLNRRRYIQNLLRDVDKALA